MEQLTAMGGEWLPLLIVLGVVVFIVWVYEEGRKGAEASSPQLTESPGNDELGDQSKLDLKVAIENRFTNAQIDSYLPNGGKFFAEPAAYSVARDQYASFCMGIAHGPAGHQSEVAARGDLAKIVGHIERGELDDNFLGFLAFLSQHAGTPGFTAFDAGRAITYDDLAADL